MTTRMLNLLLLLTLSFSLGAQQAATSGVKAAGLIHTPSGAPVPGATVRIVQTPSGQGWVTWTDESGKFELPDLPAGHYKIEAQQLGFDSATTEVDLAPGSK